MAAPDMADCGHGQVLGALGRGERDGGREARGVGTGSGKGGREDGWDAEPHISNANFKSQTPPTLTGKVPLSYPDVWGQESRNRTWKPFP
eukprot:104419-Rhodomonas_salina.5